MKRAFAMIVMAVMLLTVALEVPASAHFERGGNCHIESVRNNRVRLRMTNRSTTGGTVECGMRVSGGGGGAEVWFYDNFIPARTYEFHRVFLPGNWRYVRIVHVHRY